MGSMWSDRTGQVLLIVMVACVIAFVVLSSRIVLRQMHKFGELTHGDVKPAFLHEWRKRVESED